jgi:Sulfotransferase family
MSHSVVIKPIFVIGMPRSGTTIIAETISCHPSLAWFSNYFNLFPGFPEISVLNRILDIPKIGWFLKGKKKQNTGILPSIRRVLPYSVEAYSIWQKYCGKSFLFDYLINQKASDSAKESMFNAVRKTLVYHGKNQFITKLTGPSKIEYISSIFNDAIFIHIIRDPRSVVSSLLKVDFWLKNNGGIKPWWKNGLKREYINEFMQYDRHPAALASIQWKQIVQLTWQEKTMLNRLNFYEIRYEDFVNSPREILSKVLKSIDLNYTQEIERYISSIGPIRDMKNKFLRNLDLSTVRMIETLTRDTAKKAGYNF